MSRGLYSDPYLKGLLEEEPKLAKEFLAAISSTEYGNETEVISCIDVPGWVLEKVGIEACENPNFPVDVFEEFLKDPDLVSKNFWKIFKYPHLNQGQVDKLMQSEDVNVLGLALLHPLGDNAALLEYLKKMISENNQSNYVILHICQSINLSDEVFSYLYSVLDYKGFPKTVGQALWDNPTLSEEQKTGLVLSGIQPKDESATEYWGNPGVHFISSLPYFQSLRTTFGYYKRQKFNAVPLVDEKVEEFFSKSGHHISAVLPVEHKADIEVSKEGLAELISLELLHRLFWTDLCQREDFEIYRRNAYRTDDLFISHSILGREFEEADIESATGLGGVLYYDNQNWILGQEDLPAEQAAHELRAYEESLSTIVEEGDYEHLGQTLIALTFTVPDLEEKYGFDLTEDAEDWMIEAAIEFAERDSFDVSAEINANFGEILSWNKLSESKKEIIFEFLKLGYQEKHSKLRSDSIHFLGCMALHDGTPDFILQKLAELGDPLVNEVLTSRGI